MDRLLGFLLFLALHGVWNMGKRLVTRPRGHLLGEQLRLSNECCCLRQIIWVRIIEILAKRLCFSLPCIPCLLHRHPPKKERLQPSTRTRISSTPLNKRGKRKHISHQNRPFIVVTSCLITTHNHQPTRARDLPLPKAKPSHNRIPHQYSDARRHNTSLNNTRHGTAETSCLVRAALLASKLVRQNHNHV